MRRRPLPFVIHSPLWAIAALAMLLAFGGRARAQEPDAQDAGPLASVAARLADKGVVLSSTYLGEFAANPVGGQRQGAAYDDEINFMATVDLGKLIDLQGGTLLVNLTNRDGSSLAANKINNSISVQEKYGDGQTWQLTFLTYSQTWLGGLVETSVGRDDITFHFAFQPGACPYFQSFAICNNPSATLQDVNDGSSYWPEAVWGGLVKVNPTKTLYAKAGVYEDEPRQNPHVNHGFDFSGGNGNGEQIGGEVGYEATQPGAMLPDKYAFGTIYDTGHYSAPFYSPELQSGRGLVYVQANRTVFRPTPGAPQGLYLLGSLYYGTAGETQRVRYEWQGGALYFGAIPGRPNDNVGFQITGLHYNRALLDSLYAQRLADGGDERPDSNMTMAELNYTVRMTSWAAITPNLQYIWNPDGLGSLAYPQANLKNAFVIGAQLEIDVDRLLGLRPRSFAP
jgi:porin